MPHQFVCKVLRSNACGVPWHAGDCSRGRSSPNDGVHFSSASAELRCASACSACRTSSSGREFVPPPPAVSYAAPAHTVLAALTPVVEYIAPAPAVGYESNQCRCRPFRYEQVRFGSVRQTQSCVHDFGSFAVGTCAALVSLAPFSGFKEPSWSEHSCNETREHRAACCWFLGFHFIFVQARVIATVAFDLSLPGNVSYALAKNVGLLSRACSRRNCCSMVPCLPAFTLISSLEITVRAVSLVLQTVICDVEPGAVEKLCGSELRGKFLMSLVSAVHPPPPQLPPIHFGRGRGAARASCWRPLAVNVMRLSALLLQLLHWECNKKRSHALAHVHDQSQRTGHRHGTRSRRRRTLHWWTTGRSGTRYLAAFFTFFKLFYFTFWPTFLFLRSLEFFC